MCAYRYEMLVNPDILLSQGFQPPMLVEAEIPFACGLGDSRRLLEPKAARAAEKLFRQSEEQGLSLYGVSGYRSFERQRESYDKRRGSFSTAPPGGSEHQTGLALDVSCPDICLSLDERFAETPEGKWLAKHAPLYGFVLRYPKGKEYITGYTYEPWHIRYVTKSLALYLTLTGLTLEEYHKHQPIIVPSAVP